jgi:hypothetical protein
MSKEQTPSDLSYSQVEFTLYDFCVHSTHLPLRATQVSKYVHCTVELARVRTLDEMFGLTVSVVAMQLGEVVPDQRTQEQVLTPTHASHFASLVQSSEIFKTLSYNCVFLAHLIFFNIYMCR